MSKKPRTFLIQMRLLPVVIVCVALLLGLKIGGIWNGVIALQAGISEARAEEPAAAAAPAVTQEQGKAATPEAEPVAPQEKVSDPNDISTMNESEVALLQKLADRREELERRAKLLETRETLLTAAEKRVDERIVRLKEIETSVATLIEKFDAQEEERLAKLVQVYESMKAKNAAAIFDRLDMEILLAVAKRMDETKMADVLSKMTADAAKRLTVEMAQQKKLPGTS